MSLEGKKIVFTGSCSKSRVDMIQEARAAGLIVHIGISSKMDLLVCGEKASPSKQKKARGLGAEIVDEAEYRKRLQGSTDSD